MKLLRTYVCQGYGGVIAAHYAQVDTDWGVIEVKSDREMTEAEWLALAETLRPISPEPTVEVEAEDGSII